jgi:hypothetical protein
VVRGLSERLPVVLDANLTLLRDRSSFLWLSASQRAGKATLVRKVILDHGDLKGQQDQQDQQGLPVKQDLQANPV